MSPYIPYLMTIRQSPPTTAEIWAMEDRLGAFAFRVAALSRAATSPARLLGRLARGRRGRAAASLVPAASPARSGRIGPNPSPAEG
jgi:hypothetical protein